MCVLCGEAILKVHWTDSRLDNPPTGTALAGEGPGRARLRARKDRVRALNHVVGHYGLTVRDWGPVMYVLSDRKGGATVVRDLGGVWAEAERLIGRPLDPLDPSLVGALRAGRAAG